MYKKYHLDHFFAPPLDFGSIQLVQIGRLYCDKERVAVEKHVHLDWFEITVVTAGEGALLAKYAEIPVKSGDIFLSFPAETHAIYSNETNPLKYDFFSFCCEKEEYKQQLESIMQTFQEPESRLFTDGWIPNLVQNAIAEFQKDSSPFSAEYIGHILDLIVIRLLRRFPEKDDSYSLASVKQADVLCYQLMNYIDTHIFNIKNLCELEEITNYTYSYLSALFRKTTGQTLQEYFTSSRLHKAKWLLREGKMSIAEIAELLNYSTAYALSKAYKRKYGESPSRVRGCGNHEKGGREKQ